MVLINSPSSRCQLLSLEWDFPTTGYWKSVTFAPHTSTTLLPPTFRNNTHYKRTTQFQYYVSITCEYFLVTSKRNFRLLLTDGDSIRAQLQHGHGYTDVISVGNTRIKYVQITLPTQFSRPLK
jgi:hypothetical protein